MCRFAFVAALLFSAAGPVFAEDVTLFRPDPLAVQRFEKGYRYPQAGWIVLHIEGEPYERGYQHGRLLAPEIVATIRTFAAEQSHRDAEVAWRQVRTIANALFLRKFDGEFLEEMKGIADGATAAGAKYDGRPVDITDVVILNCWAELMTLDGALEALPTGLEGRVFSRSMPRAMPPPKGDHCSAFAATGPATADGTIVFGHITMFGLMSAHHFNVWLDVQPAKGHRIVMQSSPGSIQSGMDYYISSSGLLIAETTIGQTRFNGEGQALASRIRKVLQYANSIDEAAEILRASNNGLYTNEWLMADVKTNEIAMLELGTHASRLRRSSKGEWFGGAEGFYWGCNNTKDRAVRLETIASVHDRPENMVWEPSDRDQVWLKLYNQHKGKITADFGRLAFTTPPLAAAHSLDAKYTTSAMAKNLQTYALFGPPLGLPWEPSDGEKKKYANIRPLVSNPWTVLHPQSPPTSKMEIAAKDIRSKIGDDDEKPEGDDVHTQAAWHGTLLPATDADVWLAAAFPKYERIVATESALREKHDDRKLTSEDRERLALMLEACRRSYLIAARSMDERPLEKTRSDSGADWYRLAAGKGVLLLHDLRKTVGAGRFEELMDQFGREHAGKEVQSATFFTFMEKSGGVPGSFWDRWYRQPGLSSNGDKAGAFSVSAFTRERDRTLIVFGTADEEAANRQTAIAVQKQIRTSWSNETIPVKSDREVADEDLRTHHVVLIGRPECNRIAARYANSMPLEFGPRSFAFGGVWYANAASAVVACGDNPDAPRFSIVMLAGLSADATTRTPELLSVSGSQGADVVIAPAGGKARARSSNAKDWVKDWK